jgi:hypothetical protein
MLGRHEDGSEEAWEKQQGDSDGYEWELVLGLG